MLEESDLQGPIREERLLLTKLYRAIKDGRKDEVQQLLDVCASISLQESRGLLLLHTSAEKGNLLAVSFLLEKGSNIEAKDCSGATAMHSAVSTGSKHIVHFLLQNKANIEAETKFGLRPLDWAISGSNLEVIHLLLDNDADVLARTGQWRKTPLELAILVRKCGIVKQTAVIQLLLAQGADVKCKNNEGETPLISVARHGFVAEVKLLLEAGADTGAISPFITPKRTDDPNEVSQEDFVRVTP